MPVHDPKPLRLLFLLPFPPRLDADHGGSRAMAEFLQRLPQRHEVALIYFRSPDEPPLDPRLSQRCSLRREVSRAGGARSFGGRVARRSRLLGGLLGGQPTLVTRWRSSEFAARAREVAEDWKPDIVQIEFAQMAQYAKALEASPARRVLTVHEPGTTAARGLRRRGGGLATTLARLEFWAWKRFERRTLAEFDAVVVFTESDRQMLLRTSGTTKHADIVRIPIGTRVPKHPAGAEGSGTAELLYIGNYVHPPNVDAALRLMEEIFPRVQRVIPEAKLVLVGPNPTRKMRRAAGDGVVITGHVPNVLPFLERASVLVIPLRTGGGMRVKVLEALAHGKAVVGTRLSAAGLDVVHGRNFVFADTDDEFADAAIALLRDRDRRIRIGAAAHEWAVQSAGWDTSISLYQDLYHRVLQS